MGQYYCVLILSEAFKNIQRGEPSVFFWGGGEEQLILTKLGRGVTGPCIALKMEDGNDYLLQNLASDDIKCHMYIRPGQFFHDFFSQNMQ